MAPPPPPSQSLLDRLSENASRQPSKIATTFLGPGPDGGRVETSLTYSDLVRRTESLARHLLSPTGVGLSRGDRVVLVYPPGAEFISAFLACLRAGVVAVPVFPPHPARADTIAAFASIAKGCGADTALTCGSYQHAKKLGGEFRFLAPVSAQVVTCAGAGAPPLPLSFAL